MSEWPRLIAVTDEPPEAGGHPALPPIAYLVSQYPKLSHEFVAREIRGLRALGVEVHTFSVRPAPDDEVRTQRDAAERDATHALQDDRSGVVRALLHLARRHPIALLLTLVQALRTGPATARARLWQVFYLAEAALLVRHLRAEGLRHVHVHLANNGADIARLATALANRIEPRRFTWSMAVHGPTEFADVMGSDLAAKVRAADFVTCISDFCRSQLMGLVEPEHWPKLHVVPMSVEPGRYAPVAREGGRRPARVLFVGRLVPEKGPMVLLDALARLAVTAPGSVEARIVGAGPLAADLAARVRALGLHDVQLLGALGQDDLPDQYAWADVFCLPSFAEGLPVVLMEAMATGLPVVTTPIAGIPELVTDGVHGLLVPPGRPDALVTALAALAGDPDRRRRLGRRGAQAVAQQHDAARNAALLLDVFAHGLP
ncbi:glycosyltransferase family 4 protein [Spongisporangium articulatum]|uniref:Glycosyltransferase family 4 protein n=1 Tax=Spongisporangium articulatum TaxID=3362603 RepID=A0ABW8AT56_9ACTN